MNWEPRKDRPRRARRFQREIVDAADLQGYNYKENRTLVCDEMWWLPRSQLPRLYLTVTGHPESTVDRVSSAPVRVRPSRKNRVSFSPQDVRAERLHHLQGKESAGHRGSEQSSELRAQLSTGRYQGNRAPGQGPGVVRDAARANSRLSPSYKY